MNEYTMVALRQQIVTAKTLYERRDYAAARAILEDILLKTDRFADVHNMMGVVLHDAGEFSKAQDSFDAALKLNPGYTEAALNLAILFNDVGEYQKAKEVYARAVAERSIRGTKLDPYVAGKIANMHADLGDVYHAASQHKAAVAEFEKALELGPDFADIRVRMAKVLAEQGAHEHAVKNLRRAVSDRPAYLPARIALGVSLHALGETDEAVEIWREVLSLEPEHARAKMYLSLVDSQ